MIEVWPKESHWLLALAIPSSYPLCTTVSLPTPPCVLCELKYSLYSITFSHSFISERKYLIPTGKHFLDWDFKQQILTLFFISLWHLIQSKNVKEFTLIIYQTKTKNVPNCFWVIFGNTSEIFRENLSASLLYPSLSSANKGKSLRTNIIRSIRTSSNYQHHQHHHQHHHHHQ